MIFAPCTSWQRLLAMIIVVGARGKRSKKTSRNEFCTRNANDNSDAPCSGSQWNLLLAQSALWTHSTVLVSRSRLANDCTMLIHFFRIRSASGNVGFAFAISRACSRKGRAADGISELVKQVHEAHTTSGANIAITCHYAFHECPQMYKINADTLEAALLHQTTLFQLLQTTLISRRVAVLILEQGGTS
jgi:hypothetical protein